MFNPDKETTNVPDYVWLSGISRCASISEEQYIDLINYEIKERQDSGMSNLQIVCKEKTSICNEILDTTKCKYSLENGSENEICCKWSVPDTTTATNNFWLIDPKYKRNSNYERCVSMTQEQYKQISTYSLRKTSEYGSSNTINMVCEDEGTNIFSETAAYTKSGQSLKISFFIILALFYCTLTKSKKAV